jgi:hypothetical protein
MKIDKTSTSRTEDLAAVSAAGSAQQADINTVVCNDADGSCDQWLLSTINGMLEKRRFPSFYLRRRTF